MKHLYKIVQGNHTCLPAESDEREKVLRADGYLPPEELWPPIESDKPKRKVNGRNPA